MEATVLLCDAAEAVNGKLYVLGGGWTVVQAPNRPFSVSVAMVIAVPWDQTNRPHDLRIELLDADGALVSIGEQPVLITSQFEVGRPPGIKPGSAINSPMTWNFAGLALPAGAYEFKVGIDGEPIAGRPFTVAAGPGAGA